MPNEIYSNSFDITVAAQPLYILPLRVKHATISISVYRVGTSGGNCQILIGSTENQGLIRFVGSTEPATLLFQLQVYDTDLSEIWVRIDDSTWKVRCHILAELNHDK